MKTRNFHLAANPWNEHQDASILIFEIEEQHKSPLGLSITVHESVRAQTRHERIFHFHVLTYSLGDDDVWHRDQMRHLFRF